MSDIAINPVTRRVQFTGNTGTGPYAFTFNILVDGDIAVFKGTTELTLTTDYTVSINANGTGSITLTVALIASDVLTIIGGRELSRTTDFVTAGDLLASSLNEQLDSNVIMTQQLDEKLGRGLFVNPGDVFTDLELPLKDDRKGTVLGFNATTGDPEPGPEIGDVDTIAAISADIKTLAEIQDGTVATDAITNVNTIRANVTTVSGISGNVTTVAGISSDVTTVAADGTDIGLVAGSISNVNNVSGSISNVNTVAGSISNVNTVSGDIADVNTVAGISSDVSTVSGISADVTTVAADETDIGVVSGISSDVTTVSGISANIPTVAGISGNITTVAGISSNVTTVAGISSNVTTVAVNNANVTTVAGQTTNMQNVTDNLAAIQSAPANAIAAAGSASAAAGSATAAADSAAAAAAAFDSFDDKYLGSKAGYPGDGTGPTVDNDGNPLVEGALFFSSDANEMRVYDGANWIAASSAGSASLILYEFTATSGQTTFSGADDNGATLGYTIGNAQFVLNGVILDPSDFTATNGTSVVLASGAATGDLLNVYAFKSFTVADTVSASAGGTFAGDVTFNGAFTSQGIDDNATSIAMTLDASGNVGIGTTLATTKLQSKGGSISTPTNNAGLIANASASFVVDHGNDYGIYTGYVNSTNDAVGIAATRTLGGALPLSLQPFGGNVGIGTSSPSFESGTGGGLEINNSSGNGAHVKLTDAASGSGGTNGFDLYAFNTSGYIENYEAGSIVFRNNGAERMRIDSSGNVGIGTTPQSHYTGYTALDLGASGSIWSNRTTSDTNTIMMANNAYLNSGATSWLRIHADEATRYEQGSGTHRWSYAASGAAGTAFSWSEAMRIDSSGNLLVGKTSAATNVQGGELRENGQVLAVATNVNPFFGARLGSNGDIAVFRKDSTTVGSIGSHDSQRLTMGNADVGLIYQTDGTDYIGPFNMTANTGRDNAIDLGISGNRFQDIYATNGTIQTSDRNEKQDIEVLSDAETRVAQACKGLLRKFRWQDAVAEKGDDARIHFGIIAQDLQDAFAAEGLDAGRYAMFISTTWWEATETYTDDDGVEQTRVNTYETAEEAPEGATERTRLGVRYPELLAFIIGAM